MSFHRAATFLSVCIVLVAAACGAGSPMEEVDLAGTGAKMDGGRCVPGDTQSCICLGGGQGTQTCRASGASFGPCAGCGGTELPDGLMPADLAGTGCGNCDGCCDGATCIPFNGETNAKCGGRGQACSACPGTKVCAAGTGMCVDSSGACGACTNGCCQGNVCLQDQCSYGVTCASGACTTQIDQNAYFKLIVKTAKVLVNTTTCKDNWDFVGEPNLYVQVSYQSGGTLYQGDNQANNTATLSATWDNTTGLMTVGAAPFLIPASIITSGKLQISLYDDDYPDPDDLIAQGPLPAKTTLAPSYSTGMFGCAMDITFQLQ